MVRLCSSSAAALLSTTISLNAIGSLDAFTVPSPTARLFKLVAFRKSLKSSPSPITEVEVKVKDKVSTSFIPEKSFGSVSVKPKNKFRNDGLFSWMQPYLDLFGFTEGNTVYYGPGIKVDESKFPSQDEQERLREKAKEDMMNIGTEERERRRVGGDIATKVVIAYSLVSSIFLDDGSLGGHLARFAIVMPLFFAYGYTKSADTGLCNLAQSGRWDVDGTGIREIKDPNLARAFVKKVNKMNLDTGRDAVVIATLFAVLPHGFISRVAISTVVLGGLYLMNGKLPKNV